MITSGNGAGGADGRSKVRSWLRHLTVGIVYATCYELLREISVSHWNLPTGLRVLCLLLVPYRFWPAMMIGEVIPLAYQGWLHHDEFGWLWSTLIALPPPLLMAAPLFVLARKRLPLFRAGVIDVSSMLAYILMGGTVNALANTMTLAAMHMPPGEVPPTITMHIALTYFLGSYLGALTLAPAVLALWKQVPLVRDTWRSLARSAFVRDCVVGVLPPLLLMAWLASTSHNAEVVAISRMAVFLPVVWMTLRHGWRGAAIAGALASVAVQLTVSGIREPALIQAQALIALAVSSLLMLGGRLQLVGKSSAADAPDAGEALRGFQLARQGLYQEEQRLRHAAESLDRLGQSMRDGQKRMMERLRPVLPTNIEHSYARHIDLTQQEMQRLANALHPRSWRERGLVATFEDGPLSQAATLVGADYVCEFSGSGLNQLAPDVHMMLYRQACEVLVYLLAREPLRRIRVQIRGGCTHGRRWVVLRVTGVRVALVQRGKPVPEWRQLMSLLGSDGQGMSTVRERALIYGGLVHEHEGDSRLGVTLLLHDALRVEPSVAADLSFARPVPA